MGIVPYHEMECIRLRGVVRVLTTVAIGLCLLTAHAAGFREVVAEDMRAGVWYPSNAPATSMRLGPFDTEMALDAPIQNGQHQVVLLSHGVTGRYRNHHLTARFLADAGFIVIAPQHEADYLVGGRKAAQALDYRYTELKRALKTVREDVAFREYIAPSPVHGVGYSLGAATIMLASGAGFYTELLKRHCREHSRSDRDFCEDPGLIYRTIQSFKNNPNLRSTTDPFRNPPLITGKVVLVAPVYQGLDLEKPLSMSKLTIIAIEGDKISNPIFHAKPLFENSKIQVPANYHTVKGHHYAFIAPFPKRITDFEKIPVAEDPEGFDRAAFLRKVNVMIRNALVKPVTDLQQNQSGK